MLLIRTLPYNVEEIVNILNIRSKTENIELNEEALVKLSEIGSNSSLRFCMQLINPA